LIEHWNGVSWSIVTSANPSSGYNYLNGVTCTSAMDCWAVGEYSNGSDPGRRTLIERWNGISWSLVVSPNTGSMDNNHLNNVTCTSSSDCWAVGYSNVGGLDRTLIERWNGSSWSLVMSPNTNTTGYNYLHRVTCASASECWAVGESIDNNFVFQRTLIERWDGSTWAIVPSPNASSTQNN